MHQGNVGEEKIRGYSLDNYEQEVASKLAAAVGRELTVLEAAALMDLLTTHRFHFADGTEVNNPNVDGVSGTLSMGQAAWIGSLLARDPKVREVDVDGCHAMNAGQPLMLEAKEKLLRRISESPEVSAHELGDEDYDHL